jgi:hypothetical protein
MVPNELDPNAAGIVERRRIGDVNRGAARQNARRKAAGKPGIL